MQERTADVEGAFQDFANATETLQALDILVAEASADRIKALRTLYDAGLSLKQIAQRVGLSRARIYQLQAVMRRGEEEE